MSKQNVDAVKTSNQINDKMEKMQHEDSAMDACLQFINYDIAYIIVDFLKLSATSLSALSLTCLRWRNQIDAILDKYLQRYLPLSYKNYNRKLRNEAIERFSSLCSEASVDLQLFEFQEIATSSYLGNLNTYGVPWASHIVLIKSFGGFAIADLNKGQVIVPFSPEAVADTVDVVGDSLYPLCAVNDKRKQVVIATTLKNPDYQENDDNSEDDTVPPYYEWLYVYNVSDEGNVGLVTKFCVKNDYAVAYNDRFHAPPNIYLDGNGIIWHAVANEVKRFSIDKNEEIELGFDLNGLSVMGIGEVDKNVILFCSDFDSSPISVFDTSAKRFTGELPDSVSITEGGKDRDNQMKIVVRNNLVLVTSHEIDAIYCLNPLKKLYQDYYSYTSVAPSGNKIAYSGRNDCIELCQRQDDRITSLKSFALEDAKIWQFYWWIDENRLFGIRDDWNLNISILDKSLNYYSLPLKNGRTILHAQNVAIVGNTVIIVELNGEESRCLSIYRMKI